jgi:hypothetical protein
VEWCANPNTVPIVVAYFDIAPTSLALYREQNPILKDPPPGLSCFDMISCGIVDDWFWANQMAYQFCSQSQSAAQLASTPQTSTPMPIVQAPLAFNAREHHQAYRFSSGHLVGACVVCAPSTTVPTPLAPSPQGDRISP